MISRVRCALLTAVLITAPVQVATAQEAARHSSPLRVVGGSPERLIWVSQAGTRTGNKLRFWLFIMPRTDATVRYFYLVQREDKYDVNAQLFDGDCGARQQVRRMRNEYYLDGFSHVGATATEQHAETLTVGANSPVNVALDTLCATPSTGTSAPTMADARRLSDTHFQNLAAGTGGGN